MPIFHQYSPMEQWKKRFDRIRIAPPGWRSVKNDDSEKFISRSPTDVTFTVVPDLSNNANRPAAATRPRILPRSNIYLLDFPLPYLSPESSNPQSPTEEYPASSSSNAVPVDQLIDLNFEQSSAPNPVLSVSSPNESNSLLLTNHVDTVIENFLLRLPLVIQSHVLSLLALKDLVNLSRTSKQFHDIAAEETRRRKSTTSAIMQLFWRKDFIRFMNQAFTVGTKGTALTRLHVFGSILNQLFIPPAFLIVCYSPDIFEYEVRIQVQCNYKLKILGEHIFEFSNGNFRPKHLVLHNIQLF